MNEKKIAGVTLGCKVNQYDTEAMLELFENAGWVVTDAESDADCYIVNTCTVTHTGDQKSLKLIRRLGREHPSASIIAAGCLTQRSPSEILSLPGVRVAIGVQRRAEVVDLLEASLRSGEKIDATLPLSGAKFENLSVTRHEGHTRAVMKIQEGCGRRCAYCIIPDVRGPVRGMAIEDVAREAARLGAGGYREIVVTGIHLGSYRAATGTDLVEAIRAVCRAEGVERVRLGSLEPATVTEEFARALEGEEKLMHQFHLSLQSGSGSVLRRMRRGYTPEQYLVSARLLTVLMPGSAITTDIITGFPGETEQEFSETLAFAEEVGFARIHAFPYSRRSGTVADEMPDQVPESVKKERTARLIQLGNKLEIAFVKNTVGREVSVLFETPSGAGMAEGYSGEYVRVRAEATPGEIVRVRVTGADGTTALGEPVRR